MNTQKHSTYHDISTNYELWKMESWWFRQEFLETFPGWTPLDILRDWIFPGEDGGSWCVECCRQGASRFFSGYIMEVQVFWGVSIVMGNPQLAGWFRSWKIRSINFKNGWELPGPPWLRKPPYLPLPWLPEGTKKWNYFTSCDPHHDIYTFSYWQIFWHSIWHIFWHSIWHIFWHMFWHIFWHSIWQIFWHSIWHIFWHSIWHIFWHSIWHSIWHIFWHSIWPLRSGSAHWDLELVVEVRQCPLGSGARGWGPAVPTATWKSRLRSGSAHCDLQLAVEVRQRPLGSGARGGGPAVPTGIWTARRRRRVRRRRRRRALLKPATLTWQVGNQIEIHDR